MNYSFQEELEELLKEIEQIIKRYKVIREKYEKEPDVEQRKKLIDAINRLNEEISGIKLANQADRTIPTNKHNE